MQRVFHFGFFPMRASYDKEEVAVAVSGRISRLVVEMGGNEIWLSDEKIPGFTNTHAVPQGYDR